MSSTTNIVCSCAVGLAIALHIICMATSYYSVLDLGEMERAAAEYNNISATHFVEGIHHFGVWQFCVDVTVGGPNPRKYLSQSFCVRLGMKNQIDSDKHVPESINAPDWVKATQGLSIIGLLVVAVGAVVLVLHTIRPSKGERLRWFSGIIPGLCVTGGMIILIADVVFAHNHSRFYLFVTGYSSAPGTDISKDQMANILGDLSHLAWGFSLDVFASLLCVLTGVLQMAMAWLKSNGNSVVV